MPHTSGSNRKNNAGEPGGKADAKAGNPTLKKKAGEIKVDMVEGKHQCVPEAAVPTTGTIGTPSSDVKSGPKCTRCWDPAGHDFQACTADKCNFCGLDIPKRSTVCINWQNHEDPSCEENEIARSWRVYFDR